MILHIENVVDLHPFDDPCVFIVFSEMLQFVSNQVGDFPDLLEEQMTSAGSVQSASSSSMARPVIQTPQAPQTPTTAVYQSSAVNLTASQALSTPQSLPLTPPLTPAQTPSPTTTAVSGQQLVTRSPPLLQPRPQMVQAIQPQPQQTAQPAIQVSTGYLSDTCTQILSVK